MGYLSSRIFHAGHYVDLMVTEQNWRFLFSPNNKTRLSSEWAQQQTIQPRNMQMKQIFSMVKTQEMLQFSLMQRSSSFFMLMLFQCAPPRLPQTWSILTIFCNNSQTYYLSLARSFLMLVENMAARLVNLSVCKIVNMLVIFLLCCTNFSWQERFCMLNLTPALDYLTATENRLAF